MTETHPQSRDLISIPSEADWSGFVTVENADAIADRIRRFLGGRIYTWFTVSEFFRWRPEVRTLQSMERVSVERRKTDDDTDDVWITIVDTYSVTWLNSRCADQAAARLADEKTDHAFVEFKRDYLQIAHRTPAGDRLFWTIVPNGGAS